MSKIRLHGSSSGYTEIAPVAASGNNTITLPNDGTIISKDSNGAVGVTSVVTDAIKVGAAVTLSESGVNVVGVGTFSGNIVSSGEIQALTRFESASGSDLRLNAGSANRDVFLQVNDTTHCTIQGSTGNLQFNSGYGSVATAYGVRAWATIDGTGTVNNQASGNVSSTTDNGTGDYTVNFTNNFPDATYSVACAIPVINDQGATYGWGLKHDNNGASTAPTTKTTSACRFQARRESDFDIDAGHVMFVR